jgi:hypothetical protein
MQVEKLAAWSNIIVLVPAMYGGYGTWVLLHPAQSTGTSPSQSASAVSPTAVSTSLIVAGGLVILSAMANLYFAYRKRAAPQSTAQSASTALATTPTNFDVTRYFQQAYHSPLQAEIETNIRAAAQSQNDREGFYARFIGVGLIAYIYDMIWSAIFRSQVLSLLELNRRNGLLPLADIKTFYDQAATAHPDYYAKYSFEQWLTFMKSQLLIIRHPSDMVEITLRGKDFLKYLLHWGREATQRSL